MGKISRDYDEDVTSGKSWSSRRFLREFVVSIDSSETKIMLDYQLTVLLVKVVRTTFSENSEPVWDVHVRTRRGAPKRVTHSLT